eukprot:CAMPEP_0182474512 /NCGR_PEP_ID=MMETSP1319-20130603/25782_1 /TAXON_ID=172717 /ORGANISM="Bolidomonas pacifica, Strain RCC208" /LENGTH=147 /DNA_ID=CAMNT_0024675413 /DNA_START=105 /DNA_END=545 /DNA_ORIENTATION=-
MSIVNKPSLVEWQNLRFLIMDTPNDQNLHLYIKELEKNRITDVVRACEQTYNPEPVETAGIRVHEMAFADGEPPPDEVIQRWLDVVEERFGGKKRGDGGIAVHCVAGLGRAPVLVAIALIEHGYDAVQAVDFIRRQRRGAINQRQLQ